MPIDPDIAEHYPENWNRIRSFVLKRSERDAPWLPPGFSPWPCCEWCGKPDRLEVDSYRDGWEIFTEDEWFSVTQDGEIECRKHKDEISESTAMALVCLGSGTTTKVVLTVAHLDQDPRGADVDRLRALCQRCHLTYDNRPDQRTKRRMLYAELRGQVNLFEGGRKGQIDLF